MSIEFERRLDPEKRERLRRGQHEAVASELAASGEHDLAAFVLEQIWAFVEAAEQWMRASQPLEALRCALEERGRPDLLERVLVRIEAGDEAERDGAAALLGKRGRHLDVARLLAARPERSAEARLRAGDRLGAAETFVAAGDARAALDALGELEERDGAAHALAARLWWDLGDALQTARHAQAAMRVGGTRRRDDEDLLRGLLARALTTLGHDLAAQIVLAQGTEHARTASLGFEAHGRYRVTGVHAESIAGAAYVGIDRVTLREVEVHLLLAEYGEQEGPGPEVLRAIEGFAAVALAAAKLGHAAIRPIIRIEPGTGLVVLPRAAGPSLRSLVRLPGMGASNARARAIVAFMLDGLATAHAHGLVHGAILPGQIATDALGRPQLGPFGTHLLGGVQATRTGGLDEILGMTAPEARRGEIGPPADIFACGAILRALTTGTLDPAASLPAAEASIVEVLCAENPVRRPSARDAVERVRLVVADVTQLGSDPARAEESMRGRIVRDAGLGEPVVVVAAESWSDELLDSLCAARNPWLQTILDREGRTFHLAGWPATCRRLPDDAPRHFLGTEFLTIGVEDRTLRAALEAKLDAAAFVVCPSGERILALDRLLTR